MNNDDMITSILYKSMALLLLICVIIGIYGFISLILAFACSVPLTLPKDGALFISIMLVIGFFQARKIGAKANRNNKC